MQVAKAQACTWIKDLKIMDLCLKDPLLVACWHGASVCVQSMFCCWQNPVQHCVQILSGLNALSELDCSRVHAALAPKVSS